MQLFLGEHGIEPPLPMTFTDVDKGIVEDVMALANERVKMVTSYYGNETQM